MSTILHVAVGAGSYLSRCRVCYSFVSMLYCCLYDGLSRSQVFVCFLPLLDLTGELTYAILYYYYYCTTVLVFHLPASEHKMRRWRTPLLVLCVLLSGKRVGATCPLSSMSIETTEEGLTISGCYRESVFAGLYETTVWTIEGTDVTDTGTSAIVADLVRFLLPPVVSP